MIWHSALEPNRWSTIAMEYYPHEIAWGLVALELALQKTPQPQEISLWMQEYFFSE